jgi:hypothetical protein
MYDLDERRPSAPWLKVQPAARTLLTATAFLLAMPRQGYAQVSGANLPDAPSTLLISAIRDGSTPPDAAQQTPPPAQQTTTPPLPPTIAAPAPQAPQTPLLPIDPQQASATLPPCPKSTSTNSLPVIFLPMTGHSCQQRDQLQLIVESGNVSPLSPAQKGVLAIRAVTDPFNLLTIATFSGISVGADSHSVYGPGFKGWGRLAGYSLAEDIQGEFTGTYLLPVIFHEDPRYHRMPGRPIVRRIEHALIHTVVSQHDDGSLMINYPTLLNYPISAEISNLYVPGVGVNASDTAKRVLVGYATDPVGPLVAEFLPDFAKRVHIHIVFAQQILNRIALGSGAQNSSF